MKRVLVVEHDSLHRELIREWLEEGGVQALCAEATRKRSRRTSMQYWWTCRVSSRLMQSLMPGDVPTRARRIVLASGRFSAADMANDAMAARLGRDAHPRQALHPRPIYGPLSVFRAPSAPLRVRSGRRGRGAPRARLRLRLVLVVVAVCAAVWLSALFDALRDRSATLTEAERQYDNIAGALAEQAARALQATDLILQAGGDAGPGRRRCPRRIEPRLRICCGVT